MVDDGSIIKPVLPVEVLKGQNLTINAAPVKSAPFGAYMEKEDVLTHLWNINSTSHRHRMLFEFLWRTGTRISEALAVRKKDIDFDHGFITVRWLKSRKWHERLIPMAHTLKQPLNMYVALLKAEDRLFPISRQRADQLAKKYGFGYCHLLRHSFAVNFIKQYDHPRALEILQELLGHADIRTTQKYTHVRPKDLQKAINEVHFD